MAAEEEVRPRHVFFQFFSLEKTNFFVFLLLEKSVISDAGKIEKKEEKR